MKGAHRGDTRTASPDPGLQLRRIRRQLGLQREESLEDGLKAIASALNSHGSSLAYTLWVWRKRRADLQNQGGK